MTRRSTACSSTARCAHPFWQVSIGDREAIVQRRHLASVSSPSRAPAAG
jgi:hypothetical protein